MHIIIISDNEAEDKLATELQLALWYGHDFGTALATKLQNDVDITITNGED